jgi:pimeloyl-ACP methyl ester carboxylesterase
VVRLSLVTNPPFKRRRDALKELVALARHGWLMSKTGDAPRAGGQAEHLVVFIHGYFGSGGAFYPMASHLASLGLAPRQLQYNYLPSGSVAEHADRLAERIHRAHPDGPVCVVSHSLGGLIARYYAQVLGGRIDGLVTIGTPHRGTSLARGWPMQLAKELSPNSQLLRTLTATRARLDGARLTSVIAVQDSLVACHSAALDGSRAVYVDGVGHHGVLFHRHTWAAVENGITLDDPRAAGDDDRYDDAETGEHAVSAPLRRVAG